MIAPRNIPDPGFLRAAVSMPAHHLWARGWPSLETSRGSNDDDVEMIAYELDGIRHVKITAFCLSNIEIIKRQLMKMLKLPRDTKVKDIRLFFKGAELPNHRTIASFGNCDEPNNNEPLKLYWSCRDAENANEMGIRALGLKPPAVLRQLIEEINLGFGRGITPKLAMDGTGGSYTLSDCQSKVVAMFKPKDEEAFAPNNPRSFVGRLGNHGFRNGIVSGEGATREVAAYLIDSVYHNFCGVPHTCKVEVKHFALCYRSEYDIHKLPFLYSRNKSTTLASTANTTSNNNISPSPASPNFFWKDGSLQEYVPGAETVGDYSPDSFGINDVQRIAIFDIRMMNLDRNDGNILVVRRTGPRAWKPSYLREEAPGSTAKMETQQTPSGAPTKLRLVPIDHGLILPDTMEISDMDIVWYNWPQCQRPIGLDELVHILRIDPDSDAQKIARYLEVRPACLRTMRVTGRLLKICSMMHLTLHQTARIMCREDEEELSPLEHLVRESLIRVYRSLDSSSLVSQAHRLVSSTMALDLSMPVDARGFRRFTSNFVQPPLRSSTTARSMSSENLADFFISSDVSDSGIEDSDDDDDFDEEFITRPDKSLTTISKAAVLREALKNREIMCSKLTGIPLVRAGDDYCVTSLMLMNPARQQRQARRRKRRLGRMPSLEKAPPSEDCKPIPIPSPDKSRQLPPSLPTNGRVATSGTLRKVTSTFRRGTYVQSENSTSSIWNLSDESGRRVPIDWSNPMYEQLFFPVIEQTIKFYVAKCHPRWQEYPWNGDSLPPDYQARSLQWTK